MSKLVTKAFIRHSSGQCQVCIFAKDAFLSILIYPTYYKVQSYNPRYKVKEITKAV